MEEQEKKKAPAKKKLVFRKNYFLKGFGPVGKGSEVTTDHKKSPSYSDKLTE